MSENEKKEHVVIVGGGFGGIKAALELSRNKHMSVTLVSDEPNFRYNPTLYHTATGGLIRQSSIPLKSILKNSPIEFILGTATTLDRTTCSVELESGQVVAYDTLILAVGVVTNYFGIPGLEQYSYGIKSTEEVKRFKRHLHELIEDEHKPDLNYIIVGGGPTGVELAGALPGYLRKIIKGHKAKNHRLNIKLIEAAPRLLPRSNERVSHAVAQHLKKLGIKVVVDKNVEGESSDELMVGGIPIKSHTVVWTAGTANNPFFKNNNFTLNKRGKVEVDDHLLAEENIYVIGDNANTPFSGLAQTAVYDGHYIAHVIEGNYYGNNANAYKPKSPATVVPVGHGWAAFEWKQLVIVGWLGWFIRQAGDWIGYHDLEPWWQASEQWMTEFGEEEECAVCEKHNQ